MLNENDILDLLEEYVRDPKNRQWLLQRQGVEIGGNADVALAVRRALISAIRSVLPGFKVDGIRVVRNARAESGDQIDIVIDEAALHRESLYYFKDGVRKQGEGINDILALFTHGYDLSHRVPYGYWKKHTGETVRIGALAHRDANPFLQNLCDQLNVKYAGICTIELNNDYKT